MDKYRQSVLKYQIRIRVKHKYMTQIESIHHSRWHNWLSTM